MKLKKEDFKAGTRIKILFRPKEWSSNMCKTDGRYAVKYPFETEIIGIRSINDHIPFAAGGYEWDLQHLLQTDNIEIIHIKMTKEQLLEKAKRDYPIGTKFKPLDINAYGGITRTITKRQFTILYNTNYGSYNDAITDGTDRFIYTDKLGWAEIISKPEEVETTKVDTFVLPEKWCVKVTDKKLFDSYIHTKLISEKSYKKTWYTANHQYFHSPLFKRFDYFMHSSRVIENGYTEITFDQFKKYVLKENVETKPIIEDTSVYTLKQIEAALYKFDKEDIKDILDAIKKHK